MSHSHDTTPSDPVLFTRNEVIDILVDERRLQHEIDLEDYQAILKSRTSDELAEMAVEVIEDEFEIAKE